MSIEGLRVLVTLDAVGGVWQYSLDLARGLAAAGARPVLALLGPAPDPAQREEARAASGVTLVETGLALDWLSDGPGPVIEAGAALARMVSELKVDLVQLNMPTLAAAAAFPVPTVAVTHGCVATWWEAALPQEKLAPEYGWHRAMMAEGLLAADRVVAPTLSYARTVQRHYGLQHQPLVVHNGRGNFAATRQEGLDDSVLTVGRLWDRVKRADLLDDVAARIDAPFLAAGAAVGPHGERLSLDHLQLLGQLDRAALSERLAARPIFVSAASFEPFGLAVLEAAQAGCALVLSDIDTFRELWDGAALFVPAQDRDAYVRAISSLLGDEVERRRLGEAARLRAARYHPDDMVAGMLAIYGEVLEETASRGRVAA